MKSIYTKRIDGIIILRYVHVHVLILHVPLLQWNIHM